MFVINPFDVSAGAQHEEDIQMALDRFRVLSYPYGY